MRGRPTISKSSRTILPSGPSFFCALILGDTYLFRRFHRPGSWTGKLPTSQPGIFSVGIELDRAVGEHAGVVRGRFNLFQAATNCGIVVMPEEVKLAPSSSRGSSNRRRRSGSARSAGASDEGRRATMSIMESALKMGDWVRVVGFNCNGQIKWMGKAREPMCVVVHGLPVTRSL